jgi:hypothetical protein
MEEVELSEANTANRPLKGHLYHSKSDDELRYIIKDAGEAAKLQKGMSSEGKYLDQVNDASTVLHYRKNNPKSVKEEVELDEAKLPDWAQSEFDSAFKKMSKTIRPDDDDAPDMGRPDPKLAAKTKASNVRHDLLSKVTRKVSGKSYGKAMVDHEDEHPADMPEKHPHFAGADAAMKAFGLGKKDTVANKASKVVSHGITTKQQKSGLSDVRRAALQTRLSRTKDSAQAAKIRKQLGEETELEEGYVDHITNIQLGHHGVQGYHVTFTAHGKDVTQHHGSYKAAKKHANELHRATGKEVPVHNMVEAVEVKPELDGSAANAKIKKNLDKKDPAVKTDTSAIEDNTNKAKETFKEELEINVVKDGAFFIYTVSFGGDILKEGTTITKSAANKKADDFVTKLEEEVDRLAGQPDRIKDIFHKYIK